MSTQAPPTDRTLPHNLEAERTVLGAVLVDNQAFNSAAELLTREDFYRDSHRRIFDAMAVLAERSQPIDLVTLKDELVRESALEAVGGASYLGALLDGVPRITSVEHWSRIIKEKAVVRKLIHAGNRIVQSCYEGEDEAAALLDQAEKSIFDIAEKRIRAGFASMREIVKESFRTIDQLSQSKDVVSGLATGFVDIDEMTSGLQKGELVIVAARPAMGKTSFCLNVAQHVAMRVGETVGLFSLEMSKEQLALRLLCADARIDAHRLRTGKLNEKDWARLAKAYSDLSQSRLFIDDSATISPLEMRAKCRRLKAEHGLGARDRRLPAARDVGGAQREPPAGDVGDQPLDEGPGQGAGRAGDRAVAAVARPGSPHRPPPAALRPARMRDRRHARAVGRRAPDPDS